MGDYLRYKSALPPRLSEFVILLTAREWTQQYEWNAHYPIAVKAGIKREILDAIAEGRRPSGMSDEETILYEFCRELHHDKFVSDATYSRALKAFGEQGVVDTIGITRLLHAAGDDAEHGAHAACGKRQPHPAADPEVTRVKIFRFPQPKDPSMKIFSRSVLLCLLLAATAGCDRVTKHLAMTNLAGMPEQSFLADTIRLDYHENPGGFLGAGASWRPEVRTAVFQMANGAFLLATLIAGRPLQMVEVSGRRPADVRGRRNLKPRRSDRHGQRHRLPQRRGRADSNRDLQRR